MPEIFLIVVIGVGAILHITHFYSLCQKVDEIHDKLFPRDKNDSSTNNERQ